MLDHPIRLQDRRCLRIAGADATHFLQNLVTCDIEGLGEGELTFGALLTAQGKVLFDFFVLREAEGFVVDAPADRRDDLAERLTFYRLRAAVTIEPDDRSVIVGGEGRDDPRTARMGTRAYSGKAEPDAGAYDALRCAVGVPEGGQDFEYGAPFPHDVLMDQFETPGAGVAFSKGCYVGQEVVSRMQHRSTARRRVMRVAADEPMKTGTDVLVGERSAGTLGTVAAKAALAILRLDRVRDGGATVEGRPVRIDFPLFTRFAWPD